MRLSHITGLTALAAMLGGLPAMAVEPDLPERLISAQEAVGIAARMQLEARAGKDASPAAAAAEFYRKQDHKPLWISEKGATLRARAVMAEIRRADDWGLDANKFALPDLRGLAGASTERQAEAEARMTLSVLKYANHARGGRVSDPARMLSSYLDVKPPLKTPGDVLTEISSSAEPDAYLRDLHPKHEQFRRLRQKLLAMRGGDRSRREPRQVAIPAYGPTLVPGKRHPHVALLRKRLKVPVGIDGDASYYDEALYEAVIDFQNKNRLARDGIVGPSTRATFAGKSVRRTPKTILANMEAWRWMPEHLGDFYVWANVPEFKVRVVKDGKIIHEEKLIAGKTNQQTPVFSDEMERIVFHPYWGVPNSIKVKEIWPSLARGGNALRRHNLRITTNSGRVINPASVDWTRTDIRKYNVMQPPGGRNVLGVVKFRFPNKHQVYMHDTPQKHLFKKSVRTYSHGCMRIRNPVRLAELLLQNDKGWSPEKVRGIVRRGPQDNSIELNRRVPVHTTYFTAMVDDDGKLNTMNDIYGHEKRISLALAGKRHLVNRGRNHLAPVRYAKPPRPKQQYQTVDDLFSQIFNF